MWFYLCVVLRIHRCSSYTSCRVKFTSFDIDAYITCGWHGLSYYLQQGQFWWVFRLLQNDPKHGWSSLLWEPLHLHLPQFILVCIIFILWIPRCSSVADITVMLTYQLQVLAVLLHHGMVIIVIVMWEWNPMLLLQHHQRTQVIICSLRFIISPCSQCQVPLICYNIQKISRYSVEIVEFPKKLFNFYYNHNGGQEFINWPN